jgi:hypothetical protein
MSEPPTGSWDDEGFPTDWATEVWAGFGPGELEQFFDTHRREVFRAKVRAWGDDHWPTAESRALRVGRQAHELLAAGYAAPAVVSSSTCVELILRELTIKPIFVGLFLGDVWIDGALEALLRGRSLNRDTRSIAARALKTIVDVDVEQIPAWKEIEGVIKRRNEIVHAGAEATPGEGRRAVSVVDGLQATLLPAMRELCGIGPLPELDSEGQG